MAFLASFGLGLGYYNPSFVTFNAQSVECVVTPKLVGSNFSEIYGSAYGALAFKNNGDLLLAKVLNPQVLDQWALLREQNVGSFRPEQCEYLEYHRDEVFSG